MVIHENNKGTQLTLYKRHSDTAIAFQTLLSNIVKGLKTELPLATFNFTCIFLELQWEESAKLRHDYLKHFQKCLRSFFILSGDQRVV